MAFCMYTAFIMSVDSRNAEGLPKAVGISVPYRGLQRLMYIDKFVCTSRVVIGIHMTLLFRRLMKAHSTHHELYPDTQDRALSI